MPDEMLYLDEIRLSELLDLAHNYEAEWGADPDSALALAMDHIRRSIEREQKEKE